MLKKDVYDLSNPQKSIWFTEQFYNETSINTILGTAMINEVVDFSLLQKAIIQLLETHDNFKLKFTVENGKPVQYLSETSPNSVNIIDVKDENELEEIRQKIISTPFEISNSFLVQITIFKFPNNYGGFIVKIHHLIADGWTLGIISNKVIETYSNLKNNIILPTQDSQSYLDFLKTEQKYLHSEKYIKDKAYWENKFQELPEIASIPGSISNNSNMVSCAGTRNQFTLPKEMVDLIRNFCNEKKVSVYNFFMALYGIYIGKASNLKDFVIGTPILNRTNFKEKHTLGMFISTVPFKITLEDNITFCDFLNTVAKDSISMLRHQRYPYQDLLENLRKKSQDLPNLYHILFSYQITNASDDKTNINHCSKWSFNGNCADNIAIHLYDINDTGSLSIAYDYQNTIYSEEDINNIHRRILYIIRQILRKEDILIKEIQMITTEEKHEIIYDFNKTTLDYDKNVPIIKYFEEQAKNHPKDIALVFEKATMTYGMLNDRANSLAYVLRQKGIKNNCIVGILENRSFEMIIAILAVLKSGGSYIPIDPDYPNSRIQYMLEDSKASLLLSEKSLRNKINFDGEVIYITLNNKEIYGENKENLPNISKPDDLSYLIYTSGSTGKPKGVMLTQKNLSNFYHAMLQNIEYLKNGINYSIISITTLSFDIFAFETLISLTRGLKVYITNYYEQKITSKLERLIKENKIDIIQTTPSVMQFHIDNLTDTKNFSKLKYVMLAGEPLPKKLVDQIKRIAPSCTIYNGYGPSETTIFSTTMNVTNLDKISIGKPIANTYIYILDKNKNPVPKGTIGEIYIAGDGVGKGYLYRKELTKQKYLLNPFRDGSIMYETGDLGKWLDDGTIECKGRQDNQIKLRGLRIELGEIEEKICSFTNDHKLKAAVIVKNIDGKDSLNAFLTYPKPLDLIQLKKYLLTQLPNYMIPNTFTIVDSLPLTPNGKIDRKSLQNYEISHESIDNTDSCPRNRTEEILTSTITKKLNAENFGIDSNIFDYGADSLSIINILTDLFKYNFNLKVYDLYKYPTVRELYDNLLTENELRKDFDAKRYSDLNAIVQNFTKDTICSSIDVKFNILLTGATGFLGAHILGTLLDSPEKTNKIYCTMRIKNGINSKTRLLNKMHFYFGTTYDEKIDKYVTIIETNIQEPKLGLSNENYLNLKNDIDIVIHAAANVKHYGKYSDFENINIGATKNIVEFCQNTRIQLHHVSTMTVSGNYLLEQDLLSSAFNENSFYIKQNFDENVYAKSKLLAEAAIIEAIPKGLTATIYRIGDLTGRYTDGVFQENIEENSIYLRLRSILEIGYISKSILRNDLEFTPVDYAAKAIKSIIWSNNNKNRIFNIYNPNMLSTEDLIDFVNGSNYLITVLPQDKFIELIQTLSAHADTQKKLIGIINDFTKDNDLVYNHTIKQNNNITCKYLQNLDFKWPILDTNYIGKLLDYMKKVHFLK